MPAINPRALVSKIIDAFRSSGAVATFVGEQEAGNPRKFFVTYLGESYSVWVYIWTITHGGRESLPDEYRIQMTSVSSPLEMNSDGLTILAGYYPSLDIFSGFDLSKHRTFTMGSPSVQIGESAFNEALQFGLSFKKKDNDEIAVGIRKDQLMTYCINSDFLHRFGHEQEMISLLEKAASIQPIEEDEISGLVPERKTIIKNVWMKSRESSFRRKVTNAYESRCAVTRIQLRLVDAAHILPVASEDSIDHVTNGIALSPTIHRAYDNCLIYLDEDYCMRLNDPKFRDLEFNELADGIDLITNHLDTTIHLPEDKSQHPSVEFIREANKFRQIPGYN